VIAAVRRRVVVLALLTASVVGVQLAAAVSARAQPAPSIPGLPAARSALDQIGGVVENAARGAVASGVAWFIETVVDSAAAVLGEIGGFVDATTHPRVTAASFLEPGGAYHTVASMAVVMLVGFVILGVIHALVVGEPGQALFRVLRDVPIAVLAIVGFPWLVDQLLVVADALSGAILPGGDTAKRLAVIYSAETAKGLGTGLPQMLVSVVSFAAIALVYLELVVRNVLVRLVVALAPLTFAAIVWPAARGAGRRLLEFVVAAVLAIPAIFIALRVGLDLVQEHADEPSLVDGPSWGKLFVGLAVACVAAFTPWVVWRLLPHAEAALIAQGMSRAPMRSGMQVLQTAFWVQATRSRGPGRTGQSSTASPPGPSGLGSARSLPSTAGTGGGAAASGGAAGVARPPAGAPPLPAQLGRSPPRSRWPPRRA